MLKVNKRLTQSILLPAVLALSVLLCLWLGALIEDSEQHVSAFVKPSPDTSKGPGSTPKPYPPINITRAQYEEAHNRWLAKGVIEYEASIRRISMVPCASHVRVEVGKRVDIIDPNEHYLYPCDTIEGLFADIDSRLSSISDAQEETNWTYWMVDFDQALGHPSSISIQPQPGVQITDLYSSTSVADLKILRANPASNP